MAEDLPVVFTLDTSPTFGAPVFRLGYRTLPQRIPWWARAWAALTCWLRRLRGRL